MTTLLIGRFIIDVADFFTVGSIRARVLSRPALDVRNFGVRFVNLYKKNHKLPVKDKIREKWVLRSRAFYACFWGVDPEKARSFMKRIMLDSCKRQEAMRS